MSQEKDYRERKHYTIGVLIGNATSPHTMDLMKGIYHAAKDYEVNVLSFLGMHSSYFYADLFGEDSENDYDYQFNTIYDYAWLGKVDALIISYGSLCIFLDNTSNKQVFLDRFQGIEHVLLEEREDVENPSYIITDNYGGMYDCVEHLVTEHGYRKLLYLGGPLDNTDAEERRQAYMDVMHKHGLTVTADMMEVGDYSEYVERQVCTLLDGHPDAEALVCANDMMAMRAYRVCEQRGIRVGKDLAITGYDDMDMAKSMDPPLTTVLQNAYDIGYLALQNALELCEGKGTHAIVQPSILKQRRSCGCGDDLQAEVILKQKITKENKEAYMQAMSEKFMKEIILTDVNEQIRSYVMESIYPFVESVVQVCCNEEQQYRFDKLAMRNRLRALFRGKYGKYISSNALTRCLFDFFETVIENSATTERDTFFLSLLKECQTYVQEHVIRDGKTVMEDFQHDVWFMPLIVRDMVNDAMDAKALFYGVIVKLRAIKTTKAYIYLLEKPVVHTQKDDWSCPDEMYLAAYHEGENVVAYAEEDRPLVTKLNGFMSMVQKSENSYMFCFNIFAAERQYGVLIGETKPEDMSLLYFASMQIGAALRYVEISKIQQRTQRKLERSLQEIEDKNEVLNFLSEYDELTGCLNRRGFVERVISMNKAHMGERAVLIFGDLDHLKEINDSFGHVEGDYAITAASGLFQDAYEGESIIGRIGGDEFVMMFMIDETHTAQSVMEHIKENSCRVNETSKKPYYIEISLGYTEFRCEAELVLKEVMDKADKTLYEAKKLRRETIRKSI